MHARALLPVRTATTPFLAGGRRMRRPGDAGRRWMNIYPSIALSICPSVCPSLSLSLSLPACLPASLSLSLSLFSLSLSLSLSLSRSAHGPGQREVAARGLVQVVDELRRGPGENNYYN